MELKANRAEENQVVIMSKPEPYVRVKRKMRELKGGNKGAYRFSNPISLKLIQSHETELLQDELNVNVTIIK